MLGEIILLLLLIALSGVFSASEIAIFSLSDARLNSIVKKKKRWSKELYDLKKNPKRLLITILIANNVVNISASVLATLIAIGLFGYYGAGIATGVMTFLILIFGEITPKAYATRHAASLSLLLGKLISLLMYPLFPFILVLEWITNFFIRGDKLYRRGPLVTEDEVKAMVELGVRAGGVEEGERVMIENVLQFNDITAEDVMTPRTEMVCLSENATLKDVIPLILKYQFSRIPLYKKNKDNIIGIVHVMEVLEALNKGRHSAKMKSLSVKPFFVPEHKVISQLFKEFQEKQVHLAIVVDEYGGTAGLVTVEDLLEEIVGEIADEYDVDKKHIKRLNKKAIEVSGQAAVREINHFFNVRLGGKKTDNISAYVLKKFKKIPRQGEHFKVGNVVLYIDYATRKNIKRILIFKGIKNGELKDKIEELKS
ncbi:MAG: hemolysin family protein [Candidatus Woesearchaeota archaeon]